MDTAYSNTASAADSNETKESRTASRLSVAGILALVGARLGIEVTIIPNLVKDFLAGRKKPPSTDNALVRLAKMLFSSINQKSTYIAASAGAVIFGIAGWARGNRIEHPVDLFKHPLKSVKVLLCKNATTCDEDKEAGATGKKWQAKIANDRAVMQNDKTL